MADLMRHWRALNNTALPGGRLGFRLGAIQVGWVDPATAPLLLAPPLLSMGCRLRPGFVVLPQAADLPHLARRLADAGHVGWRDEAFDVRADPAGPVLATVDRGALPILGIAAQGVHVNGLVHRADGLHVWVARRAANRPLDAGKLDHLFAGGIAAGSDPWATLLKEGAEEAGLSPAMLSPAVPAGTLDYVMARPEGLRRDRLHIYDLVLPEEARPVPMDGEVAGFELWPAARVLDALRGSESFKFNVAAVLVSLLLRHAVLAPGEAASLRGAGFGIATPQLQG